MPDNSSACDASNVSILTLSPRTSDLMFGMEYVCVSQQTMSLTRRARSKLASLRGTPALDKVAQHKKAKHYTSHFKTKLGTGWRDRDLKAAGRRTCQKGGSCKNCRAILCVRIDAIQVGSKRACVEAEGESL
jgi:hypothetical protein